MADEYVIFEREFREENAHDNLYVKLVCNADTELQFVTVRGITFIESLGLMVPSMIIDFVDGSGDFVNHNRLDTDATYTLYFGRTQEDCYQTSYKILDIQNANKLKGTSSNMAFKVVFGHKSWEDTVAVKKNRSWGNVYLSDVVEAIANEKGYSEVTVEPSMEIIESVIQSNRPDSQFIASLKGRAKPRSEDGHYEFCGTLDNRFFFRSTYELIQEGVRLRSLDKMPLLRLGGQPPKQHRDTIYADNENVPIAFLGLGLSENYMANVAEGVTSIRAGYYDWENRRYVRKDRRFSDLNSTQLSEWSLIRSNSNYVSKRVFGGRKAEVVNEAINELSQRSLNMQDIYINIEGQVKMHCGDIVEVMIPTGEDSQVPYSELYSGFYMIRELKHSISMRSSVDFVTQVTLTRHGMDSKELSGYAKSANGRARFNVQ